MRDILAGVERLDCNLCGFTGESSDNFCRKCGQPMDSIIATAVPVAAPAAKLPTTTPALMPVSLPPSVVRGVAVLALSTGVEWALRRMAGNAARAAGRSLIPGRNLPAKQERMPREVSVDEVVYIRKVQLRR